MTRIACLLAGVVRSVVGEDHVPDVDAVPFRARVSRRAADAVYRNQQVRGSGVNFQAPSRAHADGTTRSVRS